jgi:hypothetical protein
VRTIQPLYIEGSGPNDKVCLFKQSFQWKKRLGPVGTKLKMQIRARLEKPIITCLPDKSERSKQMEDNRIKDRRLLPTIKSVLNNIGPLLAFRHWERKY